MRFDHLNCTINAYHFFSFGFSRYCLILCFITQDANQREDALKKEKEEILSKLSLSERALGEWKSRVNKLEEDNSKLRRALDQSMTRLNRMSVDSDFLVDR